MVDRMIFERVDGTIYSRNFNEDPSKRTIVGYTFSNNKTFEQQTADDYFISVEWVSILREAETNPALQQAIENVKLIYYLGLKDGKK
jgi:hypothetical protein